MIAFEQNIVQAKLDEKLCQLKWVSFQNEGLNHKTYVNLNWIAADLRTLCRL